MNYVRITGIRVWSRGLAEFIETLSDGFGNQQNRLVTATGAHGLIESRKNSSLRFVLEEAFVNLPDGMPLTWVGKLKGFKSMARCYGPDAFKNVITYTANSDVKHYFCGGKQGVAGKLAEYCRNTLNNNNVVGFLTPPFMNVEDFDYESIAKQIMEVKPNIVWVGLSTPKQELFAYNLSKYIKVDYLITVGAAFDFHTGLVRQAPPTIQKLGLEWLFRLVVEPKRLFRRYAEIVPKFLFLAILDLIKHIIKVEKQ